MLSPQQQLGGSADMQYPQDMQLQNLQDMQNTQFPQNMQSQPCTATFSYYASNGNPVYLCECPGGTSYQYLRCVNPNESGTPDVQNSNDMQQQNVQEVQEQPCTATFSYYASDRRPVYQCDCPGYGISYQYSRCVSPR
ncbi:unnamed protein product [Cylicostephanus goldi]|uniref:Uncharacterized protein n=1 Tax=Cylicostephanus goldi TaxID=71465 RepID=A0A3P6QVR7_CYLGO|nr:unnamed protein product [Cylicostephanus goldi]